MEDEAGNDLIDGDPRKDCSHLSQIAAMKFGRYGCPGQLRARPFENIAVRVDPRLVSLV
jgi:hypothetical protein